jgi:hypothetical protein
MNELFQSSTTAAPANDTTSLLAANDSVDHAVAEDGSGVYFGDYHRFDTGNSQLDGQMIMARTAAPNPVADAKAKGPMTVTGQYSGGDHDCFEVTFDRPVSRAEAEKAFFKDGRIPAPPQQDWIGDVTKHLPDKRTLLHAGNPGPDGKSSQWTLSLPKTQLNARGYASLNSGIEDKLLAAPSTVVGWVPAGTREVIDSGVIPKPGDPRFSQVRTGFPAPNDQVTCWRDANVTFRFDGKTRMLEAARDERDPGMVRFNNQRRDFILGEGMSVNEANAKTALKEHELFEEKLEELLLDEYIVRIKAEK